MNLDHIPVRLGEENARRWRDDILGLFRNAREDQTLGEADLRDALQGEPGPSSVRSPLSRFLNGHGDEIRKWLCSSKGEPNDLGRALAKVCRSSIDELYNKLQDCLPRIESSRLHLDDFDLLALEVSAVEPAAEGLSSGELPRPLNEVMEVLEDEGHSAKILVHTALAFERALVSRLSKNQPTIDRTNGSERNVRIAPVRGEVWRRWFAVLREHGRIDDLQLARLSEGFSNDHALPQIWPEPPMMLELLDAIMRGRMQSASHVVVRRFEMTRLKDALVSNTSNTLIAWSRQSPGFFKRWYMRLGHASARVNSDQLRELLEVEPAPEIDLDTALVLVEASFAGNEVSARDLIAQLLLSKAPSSGLVRELREHGVIIACDDDLGWFELSQDWARLGYMELGFELEPGDLGWLDPEHFEQELALAIQHAAPDELANWVAAVLGEPRHAAAGLVILIALTSRPDLANNLDDHALTCLWAQCVLYWLSEDPSDRQPSELAAVSEVFSKRLPLLGTDTPHKKLMEYVSDSFTDVFPWDGKEVVFEPRRPEPMGDGNITYAGDPAFEPSPFGEHWDDASSKIARSFAQLVPFQLPFEFIVRTFRVQRHYLLPPRRYYDPPTYKLAFVWARSGDEAARRAIWCTHEARSEVGYEELLEWIPTLARDELNSEYFGALDDVLFHSYEKLQASPDNTELEELLVQALLHICRHGYAGSMEHQGGKFLHLLDGVVLLEEASIEQSTGKDPYSISQLGQWLRQLLPADGGTLTLAPIRKVISLASMLDRRVALRNACHLDGIMLDMVLASNSSIVARRDSETDRVHIARLLCALHSHALRELWLKDEREPLREFVRQKRPFQLISRKLGLERLAVMIKKRLRHPREKLRTEIPDDVWETFVEWLFPRESLMDYLDRFGFWNLRELFAQDFDEGNEPELLSPLLTLDPKRRREALIKTLSGFNNEVSFERIPGPVLLFLIGHLELDEHANNEALLMWNTDKQEHEALLSWARDHDDMLLESWVAACIDPENRDESWEELMCWAFEKQPERVERIWPHIEDEHRRELLDRLNSPDDSQRISKDSPLLENLDLFEYAGQRLHFLREHEIEGEKRARVVREVLFSTRPLGYHDRWIVKGNTTEESTPAPAWLSRFWEFVNLTDVERELVSDDYTEWHADLGELSDALEVFLDADREDEATVHPGCLGWGGHLWCTDALVRQYPALLEAYIKHLVMRLCGRLSEEKFEEHWSGEVDEFVYSKVVTYIQPQMKRMKLAPDSFDRERLSARILETIENCSKRSQIPRGILSFLRENAPSIFLADITGTWSRPEKIHEWNRTDVDEGTPLEVALRRFARRYQDPESLPVLHEDEVEMVDFIEGALENLPAPDTELVRKADWFIVHLRYADTIERARSLMRRRS